MRCCVRWPRTPTCGLSENGARRSIAVIGVDTSVSTCPQGSQWCYGAMTQMLVLRHPRLQVSDAVGVAERQQLDELAVRVADEDRDLDVRLREHLAAIFGDARAHVGHVAGQRDVSETGFVHGPRHRRPSMRRRRVMDELENESVAAQVTDRAGERLLEPEQLGGHGIGGRHLPPELEAEKLLV